MTDTSNLLPIGSAIQAIDVLIEGENTDTQRMDVEFGGYAPIGTIAVAETAGGTEVMAAGYCDTLLLQDTTGVGGSTVYLKDAASVAADDYKMLVVLTANQYLPIPIHWTVNTSLFAITSAGDTANVTAVGIER